jgi:hypothetical protein
VVTTVEVLPGSPAVGVLDTVRLAATVKDQRGNVMTGRVVAWNSSDIGIATVSTDGLVTGVAVGPASITATVEGKVGSAAVTVLTAVAKVAIDRDTTFLDVGATVQLAASLSDAQGNPLSGRPVAWVSAAPEVATVSGTGQVTAVRHGLARIVATSGTRSDTAAVLVRLAPVGFTVDNGLAVTRTVGQAGDTVRATGPDGTKYLLAIPPMALHQPTAITMTPIVTASGLPLTGGLAGGVDLKPSGLVFLTPATLIIETTKQAPAGQRAVGISYSGTGQQLSLAPLRSVAGGFAVPVAHFSGAAAGFGTVQDIDAFYFGTFDDNFGTGSFAEDVFVASLTVAAAAQPPNPAAELAILEQWWDAVVQPAMTDADTDTELARAISTRNYWRSTADELGSFGRIPNGEAAPSLQLRAGRWATDFGIQVKRAMSGNFAICAGTGLTADRVRALDNALFWYALATLNGAATGLQAWFDQNVCARIVGDVVRLVEPLENGANTLEMNFRLVFGADQLSVPANFNVGSIAVSGATHGLPSRTALTPVGYYTGYVTPNGTGDAVTIFLTSCYMNETDVAQALQTTFLCGDHFISRTAKGAFSVEFLASVDLAALNCFDVQRQTTGHFADLVAQRSCNDNGFPRNGRSSVSSGLSSGTVTAELGSQPGGSSNHRLNAGGQVTFDDRIVIEAPGLAGTIGGFRARIELQHSVPTPTTDNCRALSFATASAVISAVANGVELFSYQVSRGACGFPGSGNIPTSALSGDVGFIYGQPFHLSIDAQAVAGMETGRSGVNANAKASLTYRWMGLEGLPPGATVKSATGIDWSRPVP